MLIGIMNSSIVKHLDSKIVFQREVLKYSNKHPYKHLKDACPVFDGSLWHLFGTADTRASGDKGKKGCVEVMHATSFSLKGPWQVHSGVKLYGLIGLHPCAPGVVYSSIDNTFYMFIHTSFILNGGTIECLKSTDKGNSFYYVNTVIRSLPLSNEERIYDPHPAEIFGQKYIIYTSSIKDNDFSFKIVKSINNSWDSKWEKMNQILQESDIFFQNQKNSIGREWGIEGAQLIELPNKKILLNAVCFLTEGKETPPGKKQRFFLGIADKVSGPYKILGPVLSPTINGWESGENGHATIVIEKEEINFFYHARNFNIVHPVWRYGIAKCNTSQIIEYC